MLVLQARPILYTIILQLMLSLGSEEFGTVAAIPATSTAKCIYAKCKLQRVKGKKLLTAILANSTGLNFLKLSQAQVQDQVLKNKNGKVAT